MKKNEIVEALEDIKDALQNAKLLAQENNEDYINYIFKNDKPIDVGAVLVATRPIAQRKQQMTLDYIYKTECLIDELTRSLSEHEEKDV